MLRTARHLLLLVQILVKGSLFPIAAKGRARPSEDTKEAAAIKLALIEAAELVIIIEFFGFHSQLNYATTFRSYH